MIKNIFNLLRTCWHTLMLALKSKYKMLLVFYLIWLYRIDFMPSDGSGLAKGIQVGSTIAMLFYVNMFRKGIIVKAYGVKNASYSSLLWLYTYATVTAVFSIMPQFAFFLAVQNVILLFGVIWFFTLFRDFKTMERAFLLFGTINMLGESICVRVLFTPALFIHYLPGASLSAMIVAYTAGELIAKRIFDKSRAKFLKTVMVLNVMNLLLSSSAGANVSAVFGIGVGMMFSGHAIIAILVLGSALLLSLNQELLTQLMLIIMPGKSEESLETATGREAIWEVILDLAKQKPWLGWGFGCAERVASDTGRIGFSVPDAHNNYIGFYGSLGYIGSALAYLHFFTTWLYMFVRRQHVGFTGLLAALNCALLNGYTYAFLASKACSITVLYFMMIGAMMYFTHVKSYDIKRVE